jgi:hypothetical protein
VQNYIEGRFANREELAGTLYLNASNALIRRLAERSIEPTTCGLLLDLLLPVARLFAGRMLSASEATAAFGDLTRAMEGLSER